jgi:hypothetical protein
MKKLISIFIVLLTLLFVGCSNKEVDSGADNNLNEKLVSIEELPMKYSVTPVQNKELTVSLMTNQNVGEVEWKVISQPISSNLLLNKSSDNKSVIFIATEPGKYEIVARALSDGSEKVSSFSISPVFPFDESKVEGNNDNVNIESISGKITNQNWINSHKLSQMELESIVSDFGGLNIIGYDDTLGLLVEYNKINISIQESLEEIKLIAGVDNVRNRYHTGKDTFSLS